MKRMPHVLARPKQLDVPVVEGPPPPFKAEPRHLPSYRGVLDVHPCWLLGALAVSDDLAPATVVTPPLPPPPSPIENIGFRGVDMYPPSEVQKLRYRDGEPGK